MRRRPLSVDAIPHAFPQRPLRDMAARARRPPGVLVRLQPPQLAPARWTVAAPSGIEAGPAGLRGRTPRPERTIPDAAGDPPRGHGVRGYHRGVRTRRGAVSTGIRAWCRAAD